MHVLALCISNALFGKIFNLCINNAKLQILVTHSIWYYVTLTNTWQNSIVAMQRNVYINISKETIVPQNLLLIFSAGYFCKNNNFVANFATHVIFNILK